MKRNHILGLQLTLSCLLVVLFLFQTNEIKAAESVCARVKIEIKQEMTIERQAFDGHMQINNGLTAIPLNDEVGQFESARVGQF